IPVRYVAVGAQIRNSAITGLDVRPPARPDGPWTFFRLGGGRLSAGILAPASDARLLSSRPVALSGLARAPGGAAVTDDSAYQWSSSVAGPLGSGRDLLVEPLPAGLHRILLEVAAGDETASAEVEVTVLSDQDGDGVDDETESAGGLDPDDPEDLFRDEDADGLATGAEVLDFESDPMQADSDLDGLTDGEEFGQGTSPTTVDTDGDGRTDSDDNCPMASNEDQTDVDGDGIGDVCDDDVIPPGPIFLRGDCNGDGGLDIADVVCTLDWLFLGSDVPGCIAALNTNGDESVDIGDPVYALLFSFVGGPAPVAPFPECGPGTLPLDEVMGCETPPESCR
ncbi:MAG: MSCRAMM family adhesin SdrC, partial [Chloroflexi bacterium]|nr:MSCRAMM family adhesin SdrC [Chloroflexota bacterium]